MNISILCVYEEKKSARNEKEILSIFKANNTKKSLSMIKDREDTHTHTRTWKDWKCMKMNNNL